MKKPKLEELSDECIVAMAAAAFNYRNDLKQNTLIVPVARFVPVGEYVATLSSKSARKYG